MRTSLAFFILLILILPLASATTVSFSNIHLVDSQKIDVYELDGLTATYLGEFNSTDSLTLDPTKHYQFVLKPSKMDWYQSVTTGLDYMTTTDGGQVFIAMLIFTAVGGSLIAIFTRR